MMKKKALIGLFMIILSGCVGDGIDRVYHSAEAPTPLSTATVMQAPDTQSLLDIQHQWEQSPHSRTANVIGCDGCHQFQHGSGGGEIAMWNQYKGQYESIDDYNDLCRNCHQGYDHAEVAHKKFACLDCHDQHSILASCFDCHKQIGGMSIQVPATPVGGHINGMESLCNGSGCHASATQVAGMPFSVHGVQHVQVSCAACHDAEGLQVGPLENGTAWVSWRKAKLDGKQTSIPFSSHNLQYRVDCKRCHYTDNPWGLSSLDGD